MMVTRSKATFPEGDHQKNLRLSIRLNRWILTPIGAWPETASSEKRLSRFMKVVCYSLIGLLLIPSGLYVLLEDKDTYHRIKLTGPLSFCLMAFLKYSSLILHQDDIRTCIERIEEDWRNARHLGDKRIMEMNANFGRRLVVIYAGFMYSSAVFYYLALPISAGKVMDAANLTYRPLVCPVAEFIVDTRASPLNEIFFSIQCMSGVLMHAITVGACSLAAVFAMHACGQFEVLMSWLESLVDGREDMNQDVDGRLADIVQLHSRILSFLSLTEKTLQHISLVEVVGCTLHMCLIGYHILMEWEYSEASSATYFVLFISITFNVFIFCYIGELVDEQCKKLGQVTYMIEWYRLPGKRGLGLTLLMAMSNSSIKLTAGNLIDLSLNSFGDVIGSQWRTSIQVCQVMLPSYAKEKHRVAAEHERDVNLSIQLNRWVLRPLGVWPSSAESSWTQRHLWFLTHAFCYSLIGFLLIPCALYTALEVKDTYNKIKLTGPMSFCVMATLKYRSLILHGENIQECVRWIETDWRNMSHSRDRSIMIQNANFGRRLILICALFMFGGAFFFYIAMPANVGRVSDTDLNLTFIPLVFPVASSIVDVRYSPTNEIFFLIQVLSGFIAHTITVGSCSLAAAFAMHACGQMKVLVVWLRHLVDGREDFCNDVDGRIAKVVEQHWRVLSFVSLVEKMLQQISLVEIMGCTLNMCLLGYYLITEWDPEKPTHCLTYCILLISLSFNIFIFCYIGELVSEQCKRIGDATYLTDWYRLPGKKRLGLILTIAMSNTPTKLTAGNIVELSLTSFGDVVKSSVAYLNMLRTLTS